MTDEFSLDNSYEVDPLSVCPSAWIGLVGSLILSFGMEEIFMSKESLADIQGRLMTFSKWPDGSLKITIHPAPEADPS